MVKWEKGVNFHKPHYKEIRTFSQVYLFSIFLTLRRSKRRKNPKLIDPIPIGNWNPDLTSKFGKTIHCSRPTKMFPLFHPWATVIWLPELWWWTIWNCWKNVLTIEKWFPESIHEDHWLYPMVSNFKNVTSLKFGN